MLLSEDTGLLAIHLYCQDNFEEHIWNKSSTI